MSKYKNLFLLFTLILFTGLSFNAYAGIVCGDGILSEDQATFPEECDDGVNNSNEPDACRTDCMLPNCGDNVVDPGNNEECDDGNVTPDDGCTNCILDTTTTTTTTTTTAAATTTTAGATTTTAAATTTTAGATTTTAAATTTTAGATTTTAAATTTTAGATTTTAGATTTTAAATTTTTLGGGGTTTTAAATTTTAVSTTTTTSASTTTTTLPPQGEETVPDVPLDGGDATVTISTEAGEVITDVSTSEVTNAPSGFVFPFGAISYTTTSPLGGTVTMTFEFSADLPDPLTIFKVGNNGNNELPTNIWRLVDPRTVEVDVTDGDPLTDQDGENGSIVDPIAVAGQQGGGGDLFDFGGGGCTISNTQSTRMDPIWLFLLLAPGLGLLRRRVAATGIARAKDS